MPPLTIQMRTRKEEGLLAAISRAPGNLAAWVGLASSAPERLPARAGDEVEGCSVCGVEIDYAVLDDEDHLEDGEQPERGASWLSGMLPPHAAAGGVVAVCVLLLGALGVRHTDPWGSPINCWRFMADMVHIISRQVLLWYTVFLGTAAGISVISQEAYLLVFLSRYYDLVSGAAFYAPYLTLMKITYIASTLACILLIRFRFVAGGISESPGAYKACRAGLAGCTMVSVCVAVLLGQPSVAEILWILSQVLEAVALVPQVLVFRHTLVRVPGHVMLYFWGIGAYRFLYIFNWMHRSAVNPRWLNVQMVPGTTAPVAWVCGAVQEIVFVAGIYYLQSARTRDVEQGVFRIAKLRLAAAAAGSPIVTPNATPSRTPRSSHTGSITRPGGSLTRPGGSLTRPGGSLSRPGGSLTGVLTPGSAAVSLRAASQSNLRDDRGHLSP